MMLWVASAVVLTAIIVGLAGWNLKSTLKLEPRHVTRFEHYLTEDQQLINFSYPILAVSPNGRQFVYSTSKGLCVRSMDELDVRLISSADENPSTPFFSPDGQWIAYWSMANNKLKKVAISGGAPVVLCDVGTILGASWDSDNTIVYSEGGKGIIRVPASGGTPETLIGEEKPIFYHPRLLPGGKSVIFTLGSAPYKIAVQSIKSSERKVLFPGDCAWYLPTGHIVYTLDDYLYAVPFDLDTLKPGASVPLVEGIFRALGAPQYTVSDSGTLAYVPGTADAAGGKRTLVWVDQKGKEEPLVAKPIDYRGPRISPDGTKVAVTIYTGNKPDIWIWDLVREMMTRLTFNEASSTPLWTSDGRRIAFISSREDKQVICWKSADGTGEEEPLGSVPNRTIYPWSWSGDGKTLLTFDAPGGQYDIGSLTMEGDRKWRPLLQGKYIELQPKVSPDGRWLAYTSGESGKAEIYVRPFPEINKGRWQVSTSVGNSPLWSPDGRKLFYRSGDAVMVVPVETEPAFRPGKPEALFRGTYVGLSLNDAHTWDISPDGKRFLMMKQLESTASADATPRKINIVLNWFEELKQRVPIQ